MEKAKRDVGDKEALERLATRKSSQAVVLGQEAGKTEVEEEKTMLPGNALNAEENGIGKMGGKETGGGVEDQRAAAGAEDDVKMAVESDSPTKVPGGWEDKMSISFLASVEGEKTISGSSPPRPEAILEAGSVQETEVDRLRSKKSRLKAAKVRLKKRLQEVELEISETESELGLIGRTGAEDGQ